MLPEPEEYSTHFHETYREHPDIVKKRLEWKKPKKKSKSRSKQKNRVEMLCEDVQLPPEIELPSNASAFAVFASIRLAVLDRWMKQASQDYLQSSCSAPLQDQSEIESDTEENSQTCTYMPMKVSKVVGLGLRSVFEIIKESRITHPMLCTKALSALLDVLQGQSPEDLKSEPLDIIDPLFDLLLDLATLHGPESSVANDGTHLTAIACACLLSLVVVRGDTGKYLAATAALLMCPRALSLQNIQMPSVLSSLQRSVHGVLLGRIQRPDWITHGVPSTSKTDSFYLQTINEIQSLNLLPKSLAMDGLYLYLFTSKGLFKIGSGYGGTMKGHIYLWKPDFYPSDNGCLTYCAGKLYLKLCGRRGAEFLMVERTDLLISGSVPLHSRDAASAVVFSDGEYLGTISPSKDDGFVIRMLNQNVVPASVIGELPLKLARKCVDVLGTATFEDEGLSHTVNTGSDEEIATICAGKEFGLIRTMSGKVLFCGKATALGIKQSGIRSSKWAELVVTKTPKITHISVGHDGLHAILVTEDGSAFFTGTARRGEDGDQSKVRRQPKSIKPKKIIKVDGHFIVSSACNNGTTALVTRDGELLMFGKDTTHADPSTGVVYNLKGEFIAQVALGKAHAVVLTSKGQIFTFGINNKYQCGREFVPSNKEGCSSNIVEMETCGTQDEQDIYEEVDENRKDSENIPGGSDGNNMESQMNMCPPGMHAWHDDRCMICTICRECTGYSISCLSSISERSPGQECGCGEGDSGCSICGCCRICAREVVDNSELADLAGTMRLDLIFRDKVVIPSRQRSKLQEQIQTRLEERKIKGRKSTAGPSKQNSKIKISRQSPVASPVHRSNNIIRQSNLSGSNSCKSFRRTNGSSLFLQSQSIHIAKEQVNSDVERDATRIACLPPAKIQLPCNSPVIQIACGQHHSVLLCQNGQVYSFGSNIYGQLGCGDILAKNCIQLVKLPCSAIHIAAGNNHTIVLTSKGDVFTFGNHQKGQLGRPPVISPQDSQPGQSSSSKFISPRTPWYSIPAAVPNIGPRHGRRATWVGASGDQSFIKIDESLINALSISKSTVTANKNSLVLIPNHEDTAKTFSCLVINKRDGNCNSFKGKDQMSFCGKTICLDPIYNVLWSYNPQNHEIECFNIISSELNEKILNKLDNKQLSTNRLPTLDNYRDKNFNITSILSPELSLPLLTNCFVTRFQAALNLLCTLDTLTIAHDLQIAAVKEETDERQLVSGKLYSKEDYQVVNRFEGHGGGWGYSGHSLEAIRFMADTDILLGGFGLFGGRGEYTAKLKLFDIGPDGGEQEGDGELLTETEEIPYECGPRQKCSMLFDEPVQLQAHRWYVAWCRISGPSSDCGSSGQTMVTSEDQVLFYFKSSKKSNNGTDVNAGQIPQLLYKVITPESQTPPRQYEISEPVHILSKEFSRTVTKECFQSLLSLLHWSWNTFKWGVVEGQNIKNVYTYLELERLVYICKASLRLIRTYTNEIYPSQISKKILLENVHLAESIGDVRSLLKQILSDGVPISFQAKKSMKRKTTNSNLELTVEILEECHHTFVQCFHAFYPTAYLKWTCLCDLLTEINKEGTNQSSSNSQRLLSAVLCALCAPNVRLRSTFPLLGLNMSSEISIHRNLSPSDNTGHPMMSCSDSHYYPILVEQMSYKSQMESSCTEVFSWPWKEVLERLLHLVADPVVNSLHQTKLSPLPGLTRHCCHLLGRVVAELVHQCSATEEELQTGCGRILHITPSRFTRTNQSRTWNTGNGSPDAICFQVDHPGISIAGVGVYGGIGHYDYEVELLEDQSSSIGGSDSHTHTQRWNSLEVTRGSFGPEDFAPDIIEIKFDRAVPIKENTKYAVRLRNHGGRTNNGDGGLTSVKGSDGTTFIFSTCALSFNGTTLTRGQIPVLLYYSNPMEYGKTSTTKLEQQARKAALSMTSAIFKKASELMTLARSKAEEVPSAELLSTSCLVTTLLPLIAAHISPLVTSDPRSAVYILGLIYELLPHIAALNLIGGSTPSTAKSVSSMSNNPDGFDYRINTSSPHYTWIESDHPYKPATVSNYRVKFPESVKWLSLEFDPSCSTVQPEDTLQLYVPALGTRGCKSVDTNSVDVEDGAPPPLPYWPVLHKFSGCLQWPGNAVILPGNEVIFSLETASDYLKDEKASAYGFKCLVIGYEWPLPGLNGPLAGLKNLESELAFLGGMCAASLMKKDLLLPTFGDEADIDIEMAEMVASVTFAMHAQLLSKGLALNNPPTVSQALDGMLPYSVNSNERLFLRDFVSCVSGSSGGRLAQWLQPGSRVDPSKCQVLYSREELRCGWPAMITIITRDQYTDIVHVPNMKVDIKAIPIDKKELGECDAGRKMRRVSQPDAMTFGGLPPPPLQYPYEPTVRDKMYFHSITVMKPYQNYSFEELRFVSPPVKRSSESMLVRPNLDGTYCATWTPASIGCYSIVVNIDGYDMEEIFKVEVKEPPQGMTPPSQQTTKKNNYQPNKLRKFVAKNSAGLRIRAHPSLQSEQIGVVHVNGTIAFIDEIHNDDGVWLRLSMDTIKQYCNSGIIEAWCLQYNQHLGKTLLLPVEEPKATLDQVISETIRKKLPEIHDRRKIPTNASGDYIVIKCGASGHNVRSNPNLKAPRVGMLVLGNRVGVSEYIVNSDGCWVLLDEPTKEKYCFNTDEDAWSLAMEHNNTLYLGAIGDNKAASRSDNSAKRGFDFTQTLGPMSTDPHFFFGSPLTQSNSNILSVEKPSTNPFIFGECSKDISPQVPKREKKDGKISGVPKWLKGEDEKSESPEVQNLPPKEAIKPSSENRANGNGTPPDTPKRSNSPSRGPFSPKILSRSSSPVAVPLRGNALVDSAASSNQVFGSPKSIGLSPLVSSGFIEHQARRDSTQSDTSAFVSSLTRDSQSTSQATPYKDLTSSPSGSSIQTRSDNSNPSTPCKKDECCDSDGSSKKLTQTGTQTSPENLTNVSMKGHFSIGSTSKEEKLSPKLGRKERGMGKVRSKRSISPASSQPVSSKISATGPEQAKIAMSPSMAEALRAVFAAFLWHEGIVHDAMACASFLKFHPTLPKQGALVVTRHMEPPVDKRRQDLTKEERARQRHSVEVTTNAGSYLHIQPATLESLTRSAANANANRNRSKKLPNQTFKEEAASTKGSTNERSGYTLNTVSVLPPALKSLVYLWEELSTSCFQAISQQMILQSPIQNSIRRKDKITNNTKNDCRDKNSTIERDSRRNRKKKATTRNYLEDIGIPTNVASDESETICELCGESYPHPVTYHMHQAHPGCGQHAGGKGYNSRGNYCLGWAGSCGDGGVPGSSWYLMCENCREKYVKAFRSAKQFTNRVKNLQRRIYTKPAVSPSVAPILEPHIIMRNNSMFLLDLASSADTNMAPQRRSSMGYMPSLSENNSPPDCSGPFSPMPPFQCLQSLGASLVKDETNIYEVMFREHNLQDGYGFGGSQRPLSEISASDDGDSLKGSRFHRSISMGTNGIPWSKSGLDGRIIMTRRRNNSSKGGSSLLCNPSTTLQQLIPKIDHSSTLVKDEINGADAEGGLILLQRPVMQFLLQQHDLQSLKLSMRQALRKAMCRVYAMQALNWLLKSVTQPLCLHDLLWWFVTSLTPSDLEIESEDDNRPARKLDEQDFNVCEHPLSDIVIAGDAVHPLPSTFHALLQTIADLMVLLPMGSPIQQMAVRCWGLRFATSDHSFLHRSQVFSNISKILSRSEELEDCTISMHDSHYSSAYQQLCAIESLKDLTFAVEIKSSSRQAMVGSLTDSSTETFWESGDEDRNKTKSLVLVSPQGHHPALICVHIDNCRDLANKVSNITFFAGPNSDELVKLRNVELETRLLGGWINCPIPENNNNVLKVELKGPDNSVRVRQIRVLGTVDSESLRIGKQLNSYTIQQKNCEAETLRVFRLITSQVFGKLIQGEEGQNKNTVDNAAGSGSESLEPLEESNDLREHMVGILFSRSKLTHLQKQVIVHIVQAIRKESMRVRDEWELSICSSGGLSSSGQSQDITKNSDTYCFEMLSMVLALSGSSVGRAYLSHQGGLLGDLLSLLHTGSARVQRQVTSLLRRMLPEITPDTLARVLGVSSLPPKDFNVVLVNNKALGSNEFDIHRAGILDVFLSIIAKALTVQVKLKGKTGCGNAVKEINTVTLATSVNPKENLEGRWWLKGFVNRKLAEVLVNLIKDMAAGKLSDTWARIAKGAIAENILNLTHLSEEQRTPSVCLKTPTLWLALASLCVLDKDHVERLSSGQWTNPEGQPAPPRPTCINHDDGETNAVIQCSACGNLCADCDRFLHLHRKTRHHQRQVCKEEEEAIKVELHEGCGRIKLFWLLALADARTLKALIEYREGGTRSRGAGTSGVCRFCGATGTSGLLAIGNVCADQECQEYSRTACTKLLHCGHMCGGILEETKCLPCLHGCTNDPNLRQDADDMCMICFTEALSCAPAIQLQCGHVFHLHCCKTVLMKKWTGPRITFSFSQCPICKKDMEHPNLEELLEPIKKLLKDVQRKALMRLEYEGLHTAEAVVTPGARFYNEPASYAMDRYAYYVCFKCNKAYYGGEARCDAEVGENYDPEELVCGACSDVARAQMCPKHGTDFLEYKCRYCCSVAVFFCFGTTHFCNPCHDDFQRVTNLAKAELPSCPAGPKAKQLEGDECPLHIKHPPTGEEFALGCGVCRNAHTF